MRHNGHFKPAGQEPRSGKGGKRPGAGRKSKEVIADEARAAEIAKTRMARTIGSILDVAEKLCRGIRRKKFHPKTGEAYWEIQYDSAMIRFWIDRFVPPARAGMTMAESTPEEFWRALEEARRREAEEKAAIEVKVPDPKKEH
jgi:hypothetical protein